MVNFFVTITKILTFFTFSYIFSINIFNTANQTLSDKNNLSWTHPLPQTKGPFFTHKNTFFKTTFRRSCGSVTGAMVAKIKNDLLPRPVTFHPKALTYQRPNILFACHTEPLTSFSPITFSLPHPNVLSP